jgi:hypothetical protein
MQRLADGSEERISSSLVRRLIAEGQVECAAEALGRAYLLIGCVVRGAARGRKLGFPTANVEVAGVLLPADGIETRCYVPLRGPLGDPLGDRRAIDCRLFLTFAGGLSGRCGLGGSLAGNDSRIASSTAAESVSC